MSPIVNTGPGGVVKGPRESHAEQVQAALRAANNPEVDRKTGLRLPSEDQWAWTSTAKRKPAKMPKEQEHGNHDD